MSHFPAVKLIDETGAAYGVKHIANKPRVNATPYLFDIAEGNIPDHVPWSKIGYNGSCGGSWEDVWPIGGLYVFPNVPMQMEAVSSSASDVGVSNFSGTSTGGTATSLIDTTKNFLGGTPVAAGDVVIMVEDNCLGVVTAVAATELTVAGGFSSEHGPASPYIVVDVSAGGTGLQVVRYTGLDTSYAEISEFVVLNGTTVVPTVRTDILRVNSWRAIVAGSAKEAAGNVDLRHLADTPIYARMEPTTTRARTIMYTVPAGHELFVTSIIMSAGAPVAGRGVRMVTRATYDPSLNCALPTSGLFLPFTEVVIQDGSFERVLEMPTKLPAKTDLKISVISPDGTTQASCALKGWLETTGGE